MAKRRKIGEVVSNTAPKTKEKSLSQSAQEQNDFNDRNRYVDERSYKSTSDPDPLGRDNAESLEPGFGQKKIADKDNFTSSSARKMDPVYNYGMGLSQNKVAARKGLGDTLSANKNQPTLDNPNATGLDEKTEPMPTKQAGKVDSKQGSTLVNATQKKETEKMDSMPTLDAGNVSQTQGQSLVTAIQENPVAQVTQNEILNTGVKDASSPSQLQQAVQVSTEAKKEAEKMEGSIDEALADAAKVTAAPYGSFDAVDAESEVTAQAGNTAPTQGDVTAAQNGAPQPINIQEQVKTVPGDGSAVSAVVSTKEMPTRPTYEQVATNQDAQQGMASMYAKLNEGVPKAVVEKLGVQDYYPNIGRDIAVGTFSGSRIGSQTIYSGAGAALPMGLYDARKRALKEAATEKKKQLDKFFDVIETAPQYTKAVNESYNNWLNDSLAKHGYDADKFLSDPNMRKEYTKRLTNAKDITYWATWADNYLKESEKKENYGSAEGVKVAGEIKMALIDHMDEIASGEKSLKDFIDINKAKMYQNIIPQMDTIIKEVLDPNRMGESPINMRTGDAEGRLDPEEFRQQRDQFVVKMKSGTLGKDEYLSGFKKFFTGDYEKIVDGLIESGKFSEEQRDAALDYFAGQMQEQIKLNPQFIDNDQMEMAKLAEDRRQFDAEFEYKKEQGKTPWTVANELMNRPSSSTGKTMQQELLEARKKGYTGSELKTYMLRKAREMGFPNAQWDEHLGTVIMKSPASQYESSHYWNVSTTGQQASIKLFKKQGNKWVPFSMPLSDFVADQNAAGKYKFDDGSPVTSEDQSAWKNAWKQNSVAIKPSAYETYYGVSGSGTGIQRPVSSTTIKDYDPKRGVNIKNSVGTGYGYNLVTDENGKAVPGADGKPQYTRTALKGTIYTVADINDETQRRVEDGYFGNDAKQFQYTQQGGTSSSSSGRVSSQSE